MILDDQDKHFFDINKSKTTNQIKFKRLHQIIFTQKHFKKILKSFKQPLSGTENIPENNNK